ncbi:MAG: hypothetical protein JXA78_02930 [Anaerolineales bacterium]|nr:hypothetical protein [Anaerolineales bacterium]
MSLQENHHPADLPQTTRTWHLSVRPLSSRPGPKESQIAPACIALLTDLESGEILASEVIYQSPDADSISGFLFQAMQGPTPASGAAAYRPQTIQCEDAELVSSLAPILADIGVQISHAAPLEEIDILLSEIETMLESEFSEIPGLLSVEEVTPELLESLFAAAADFYRAAPWQTLADDQPLAVDFPSWGRQGFVQLMGNAGMEFGLVLFWDWDDVLRVYQTDSDPLAHLPESGWRSLSFENADILPAADLEAQQRYHWQVASSGAYPFPIIYTPDAVERPSRQELIAYLVLLRAIPRFTDEVLQTDPSGDLLPAEGEYDVQTPDGKLNITIRYPAGNLPEALSLVQLEEWYDENNLDIAAAPEDAVVSLSDAEAGSKSEKARRLMQRAWEEHDPDMRLQLARQALKTDPNCSDAYLLLAEEAADDLEQACKYYRKSVQAGERALGKTFIEMNQGNFWKLPETRPYMRARLGLADCLAMIGKEIEALQNYREMLRLNPDDNQGIRYSALALLLQMQLDPDAMELLEIYPDDASAAWLYSHALLAYRRSGDSPAASTALDEAIEYNPNVPAFLTGQKSIPEELPSYIGFGDESEAIYYAADHYQNWWNTRGAVEWLKRHTKSV